MSIKHLSTKSMVDELSNRGWWIDEMHEELTPPLDLPEGQILIDHALWQKRVKQFMNVEQNALTYLIWGAVGWAMALALIVR